MSQPPIVRNPDLLRLAGEGYALEIDPEGVLLVKHVPYVTPERKVKRGIILAKLATGGSIEDVTGFPDHTVFFAGEMPCAHDGRPLTNIVIGSQHTQLTPRLAYDHHFSSKPGPAGYASMYDQIRQYVVILESHARKLEPDVSARLGPRAIEVTATDDAEPFVYADTASVRAGIAMPTAKLRRHRIAIVGLGGTGSYVLDQVSKTPVAEIHLYDDDVFLTHNAFRAPGAAAIDDLRRVPLKVDYWRDVYSEMHRGIQAHSYRIIGDNVGELEGIDFVFLCMDSGPAKRAIIQALQRRNAPFVDCGIGVQEVGGRLRGTVRVTLSTATKKDHVQQHVSFAPARADDDYERNIQVADLNALNALMAVIKWKKLCGFYHDFTNEHQSTYTINSHLLTKEEQEDAA